MSTAYRRPHRRRRQRAGGRRREGRCIALGACGCRSAVALAGPGTNPSPVNRVKHRGHDPSLLFLVASVRPDVASWQQLHNVHVFPLLSANPRDGVMGHWGAG